MNHSTEETGKFRKDHIKLALIPVLLLVLAAILFWPDSAPQRMAKPPRLSTTPVNAIPADHIRSAATTPQLGRQWPSLDLSEVTAVNPFAKSIPIQEMLGELPEAEPPAATEAGLSNDGKPPAAADASEKSESPQPSLPEEAFDKPEREIIDVATIVTLQAIIESDRGRSALIDSRIFRVGDLLNDEYRITEISPTAVFVEWIDSDEIENGESN